MNKEFLKQMQDILKDEYPAYLKCLEKKPYRGFRVNPLKTSETHLFSVVDIAHTKSPYASYGYYTDDTKYGYTPEYMAGAFYMQEASASSAVTILQPKQNCKILDMCASPGSKTTQILEMLHDTGILVANEIDHKRAQVLLENVERNGAKNCVVTNSDTSLLAIQFPSYFDMVLCDAPCSGEGMMRKNEEAITQWSPQLVEHCAALQKEILENAYTCLNADGILVYSTCTLNMQENEYQILQFLKAHPDMEMMDSGVSFGRKALIQEYDIDKAIRIYPMNQAEGHFIAKMHKKGQPVNAKIKILKSNIPDICKQALTSTTHTVFPYLYYKNDKLYGGIHPFIDTGKVNCLRQQVYIGECKKNRFEFSHHFFMCAHNDFMYRYEMDDKQVKQYMHGEQISAIVQKGWVAMCYHGLVIGGAKSDGNALKNKYPKALRTR